MRKRTAAAALEEAFKTLIGHGKYPGCVLQIEISPGLVDVNVHPAKIEVRFVNERPVFQCIYFAVKTALTASSNPIPLQKAVIEPQPAVSAHSPSLPKERMTAAEFLQHFSSKKQPAAPARTSPVPLERPVESRREKSDSFFHSTLSLHSSSPDIYVEEWEGNPAHPRKERPASPFFEAKSPDTYSTIREVAKKEEENTTVFTEEDLPTPVEEVIPDQTAMEKQTAPLRLIGELNGTYILLERQGDLVLVDKHAAHERLLYEKLKTEIAYGNRQVLLTPLHLELSRDEAAALLEHAKQVEALGFFIEDFGGGSVLVREVPLEMGERDIALLLGDIADKLMTGRQDITPDALDKLYYNIACKAAVRARDKNSLPELAAIVDKLAENPQITHCPHGRPVQVTLTGDEIEKMFGRQG